MSDRSPPPLTYRQTTRLILSKLANLEHPIVLIGGQAVNFWTSYYAERIPEVVAGGPYTSKDVDFCGSRAAVRECARRLGGKARLATIDDATPNAGIVTFVDDDGHRRTIDFVTHPFGLHHRETLETSIRAEILSSDDKPTGAAFRVMHPVLCLESRAYNVAHLPGYDTPHALRQLRAATACAGEILRDLLEAGSVRPALRLSERVFRLASGRTGLDVYGRHGIDVFEAVRTHPKYPANFLLKRWPRMLEMVANARERGRAIRSIRRR